jgi:hypothetical protein
MNGGPFIIVIQKRLKILHQREDYDNETRIGFVE